MNDPNPPAVAVSGPRRVKRRMVFILLACLTAVGVCAVILTRHWEPLYQGRPVHEWVEALSGSQQQGTRGEIAYADAKSALEHLDTNAIPLLLEWIAYEPKLSNTRMSIATLIYKVPFSRRSAWLQRWLYSKDQREVRIDAAVVGFAVLGPGAVSAAPDLARLATFSTNTVAAHRAIDALTRIGPLALPALLSVITNRNSATRFYATRCISNLGTNALPAIPTLILCLTNPAVAGAAFETLGHLKLEPELVVPSLIKIAGDQDALLRTSAILTLGDFGQEARRAVPTLLTALSDDEAAIRDSATNALQSIAPETVNARSSGVTGCR